VVAAPPVAADGAVVQIGHAVVLDSIDQVRVAAQADLTFECLRNRSLSSRKSMCIRLTPTLREVCSLSTSHSAITDADRIGMCDTTSTAFSGRPRLSPS